jgi:hypothetical protein
MDIIDKEILTESYPSNSKKSRMKESLPETKKQEKVVTGIVKQKKKSWSKKLAEIFFEDDTKSVGSYIWHDVLIPAGKSMICDIVGWGGFAEMLLFGDKRGGSRTRRESGRSYTSYGSYYSGTQGLRDRDKCGDRDISKIGRARHDFDEIVLETRGEAEDVLSHLVDLTIDYGMATVADLYDLVGITSNHADIKYGWTDLRNSSVSRVRGGYLINLPRTQTLD